MKEFDTIKKSGNPVFAEMGFLDKKNDIILKSSNEVYPPLVIIHKAFGYQIRKIKEVTE